MRGAISMILQESEIQFICTNLSELHNEGIRRKKIIFRDGIGFSLLDAVVDRYDSQVKRLLRNPKFMPKFSEKYLEAKFDSLLISVLKADVTESVVSAGIKQLESELLAFDVEQRVLVPLAGIQLEVDSLDCGAISLIKGGNTLLESVLESISEISKTSKNTPESQQQFEEQCNQLLARGLMASAVAEYTVIAEPKRAKERALEETRRVIDVFRYTVPALYSKDKKVAVGISGEVISDLRTLLILSTDGSKFSVEADRIGMLFPFTINEDMIQNFERLGVQKLFDLLAKDYSIISSFDKSLLNSIHWFASFTTQLELENQVLNLLMSLESLLTPKDSNPIGTAIAEGVAWIIGNDIETRKRIKKRVQELYRIRSGVAHGGKKTVQPSEVEDLTNICGNVLASLIPRHAEFKSQKALLEWIEERKLS